MKEIIEELNNLKIVQTSIDFLEDLPDDIYKKYFKHKGLEHNLDIDKHRWYETGINVYNNLPNGLLGVRSVTDTFSESSEVKDMYWSLIFFEMEEVSSISYKIKK